MAQSQRHRGRASAHGDVRAQDEQRRTATAKGAKAEDLWSSLAEALTLRPERKLLSCGGPGAARAYPR